MIRFWRLLAPGLTFSLVGTIWLVLWGQGWVLLRGGLVAVALWALAVQIVASVLAVSALDDLRKGSLWLGRLERPRRGGMVDVSSRPTRLAAALRDFYRLPFLPVMLLMFGAGVTLSGVAMGVFEGESTLRTHIGKVTTSPAEIAVGVLFAVGALAYLVVGGRGAFLGFVVGFASANVVGQAVLAPDNAIYATLPAWGGIAFVSAVAGLVVKTVVRAVSRRRLAGNA
ncbi:hypothetical protein HH310_25715 [Actinoplanes sp. TBRC 11911]|uniref:hypothetical protein n=1 Tax=Actinoplanes sp. TBRC 11911 TaxID=2729386 RepID=UPI00145E826B|nr:hypothetical protein [Actinoplanes sp. TBRC 11911]NMO54568.1 hypothetical protein [Actinoplanes sp. TBRC 11911]